MRDFLDQDDPEYDETEVQLDEDADEDDSEDAEDEEDQDDEEDDDEEVNG